MDFASLQPEYLSLLTRMTYTREAEATDIAERLVEYVKNGRYGDISAKTGIPLIWVAASFEREAGSNFRLSPAQGDPWNKVSKHVPAGRGPFSSWSEAALDAYRIDGVSLVTDWSWARMCFEGELYNGFGYRRYGINTPYLWSGTSVYDRGKYSSDGQFSKGMRDQQLGMVPVMLKMVNMMPDLHIDGFPVPSESSDKLVPSVPDLDVESIQRTLNIIDGANLDVDGNYGRRTRAAVMEFQRRHGIVTDGIVGPQTMPLLNKTGVK